jgi:hypothetical protein
MKPEYSFPFSRKYDIGSHPEPEEPKPHPHSLYIWNPFKYYPHVYVKSCGHRSYYLSPRFQSKSNNERKVL